MCIPDYRIFLSHSSADLAIAKFMHQGVQGCGASCFADFEGLRVGDAYRTKLILEIQSCNELLLLVSTKFLESPWFDYEVGIAEGANKPIFPIFHGLAPGEIADLKFLRHLQAVDLVSFEKYLNELTVKVREFQGNKVNIYQAQIANAFTKKKKKGQS